MIDGIQMGNQLKIYDPRSEPRLIQAARGSWSSTQSGVVFFETDSYDRYTNSKYIGNLLRLLVLESGTSKMAFRVSKAPDAQLPERFEHGSNGQVTAIFDVSEVNTVIAFFDEHANAETWNFYGLKKEFSDRRALTIFPNLVGHVDQFYFAVEVDLDSILMGFISVGSIDRMVQQLRAL